VNAKRFRHFAAIDWSGASGERHRGIAVALCTAETAAPALVRPGHRWSRLEVFEWLRDELPQDTLVGLDLCAALAFADCGAFLPGYAQSPADAHALWALVEKMTFDEPHLGATSFVDHPDFAPHFRRHGGREGLLFGTNGKKGGQGRLRVAETHQKLLGCKPYSNFNLVGAAQVGKASLTGMRVLHRLSGHLPFWPVDPLPDSGSVVVEIYTAVAALAAGRSASRSKMRSYSELNAALHAVASAAVPGEGSIDDHASDALLAAAWLRDVAHRPELWQPAAMSPEIARTEGWTFGVP
jgi:hypothetical protein